MAISTRLRYEVLRRSGHACRYCGAKAPDVELVVDHVTPVALGGKDEPENLVAACHVCNIGKSSMPPDAALVADVSADALRWAAAMKEAQRQQLDELDVLEDNIEAIGAYWMSWITDDQRSRVPLPLDWRVSLRAFCESGLPYDVMIDAVEITMRGPARGTGSWPYFCGICWRKIDALHACARSIARTLP